MRRLVVLATLVVLAVGGGGAQIANAPTGGTGGAFSDRETEQSSREGLFYL